MSFEIGILSRIKSHTHIYAASIPIMHTTRQILERFERQGGKDHTLDPNTTTRGMQNAEISRPYPSDIKTP